MKIALFATAAVMALGLAACGGEPAKPAEPAPAPAAEVTPAPAPEVTPASTVGETPADVPAFMKTRHDNYEALGKNMKVLMDNMKAATPDMAAVTAAAAEVKKTADVMGTWFPAGTGPETGIKTGAKANIWTDRSTFDAAVVKLQAEATTLAGVTDAAGFKAQFPKTGGACKNCHDTFREEEKDH
jgi:cytochrome c556